MEIPEYRYAQTHISSKNLTDPDFKRLYYVRYADNFLIGVTGTKKPLSWSNSEES